MLNKEALRQTGTYEQCYRISKELNIDELAVFVILSSTPHQATLEKYGYHQTEKAGVYQSANVLADDLTLILLNQLPPEEYNAFVKLFASRKKEQRVALSVLNEGIVQKLSSRVTNFIQGIVNILFPEEEIEMEQLVITPEYVMDLGERLMKKYVEQLPIKERLAGLSTEDVLRLYKPEEILLACKPEERLAGLQPEECLAGLTREEIETYLQKLDSSNDMTET